MKRNLCNCPNCQTDDCPAGVELERALELMGVLRRRTKCSPFPGSERRPMPDSTTPAAPRNTEEQLVGDFLLRHRVERLESQLRDAQLLIVALIQSHGGTVKLSNADVVRIPPDIVIARTDDFEGMTFRVANASVRGGAAAPYPGRSVGGRDQP